MSSDAGPSSSQTTAKVATTHEMSPRQKEKSRAIALEDVILNEGRIDHDLSLLISQYLHAKPNTSLARTFDEEILGIGRGKQQLEDVEEVERALLDGEFGMLEGLISRPGLLKPQSQRAFLYMCYRQQFLEHIENRESQKAFNLLQKRLKPLEHYQPIPHDFYNLCYLTSAGTVHDAPGMKDWGGVIPEREKLVGMWKELTEGVPTGDALGEKEKVDQGRLVQLMRQAVAWQVGNTKRRGEKPWRVKSLLHDYSVRSVPDTMRLQVTGHTANVKCVDYIGEGAYAVSGSSDSTLRIFSLRGGEEKHILTGHGSRIWDCATSASSSLIASASGDGTVRIWSAQTGLCESVLQEDSGDVYSVRWRPHREDQIISASYDRILRAWDVETGAQLRTFSGHSQSTLAVAYDHTGNVLASGSKDKHVRLWDAVGGMCVKTMPGSLGEVTSVEFDADGKYLLAACKDNSNRLWDLRMQRILYRYTGHQNTSKNLIRCSFGGQDSDLVVSGSEDGNVYIWDREASSTKAQSTASQVASGAVSPALGPASATVSRNSSLRLPLGSLSTSSSINRASPAYYPPKISKQVHAANGGAGVSVRPVKVLSGHGEGAVFDVRWRDGGIVSAGEDGVVGVWCEAEDEAD